LLYYKFPAKSVGERILKIGQYLAKLEAKIEWHLCYQTCCISNQQTASIWPTWQIPHMYRGILT